MNDLRLALRVFAKSPGFAIVAVLMLALGIGLSASSFSFANAFLLRDVPSTALEQLVRVSGLWLLATNVSVLIATMFLACWLPARRAARIDPVAALRGD